MTDKRLKEIKDSIDLQLEIAKHLNVDNELLMEEKELYEYAEELKKQLEEIKEMHKDMARYALDNEAKIDELNSQQKEFINYLEDLIKFYKNRDSYMVADILGSYDLNNIELELLEEILQKYKSIIGSKE